MPVARTNRVAVAAAVLIVVQLVVRGVLAFGGDFYWDDLILVGRAGTQGLFSPSYLFDDHDGHVMPAAFLLAGMITKLAPLTWFWPALSLVVLQALASLALLRALWVILGWRPVLLVPLTFALFTPLAIPGFTWWSAALNSLPMLTAMCWFVGDAVLLDRTGNRRYAATAMLSFLGGLLFFEKSVVIPFVAFAVVALLAYRRGDRWASLTLTWRRGTLLWVPAGVLTAAWIALYLVVVDQKRWSTDLSMTWSLLQRSFTHGVLPGLVGGPWRWDRWVPSSPWAEPSSFVIGLGAGALIATIALTCFRKQQLGLVWLTLLGYLVTSQAPIYLMRSSAFTALLLAQTLRYLPDLVVVATLLAAVGLTAPNRPGSWRLNSSSRRTMAITVALSLFVASSLVSTISYLHSWRNNPAAPYIANVKASLAAVADGPAVLDQEVDPLVLQNVVRPENLLSHMFALVEPRPEIGSTTTQLRMLDRNGHLLDAQVTWVRSLSEGPVGGCGYLVQSLETMPLSGPLLPADWIVELNYLANTEGAVWASLTNGPPVKVPVRPGLNRVFIRLPGSGNTLTLQPITQSLSLCIAVGPVGALAPR
ncbi:hypothetical protein FZI91_21020 [Mycobacterium sp. CBMA271]|uniref:hypothetical protein n=1 Tax=unclassified Mycobacteroides TaxID=2618759 RepID=UPI0012DEBCF7|nr:MULTISPECIES: hypothetical protein [unclassified Mycobacteroides]MUM19570.1 hypothetical protein [Mycobacteroides sp. CBMA 326]MUM24172.1 hypothetical protein [Mycobacteroides sp. CBMA 271]